MTEIKVYFDVDGRKFDYAWAEAGNVYLESALVDPRENHPFLLTGEKVEDQSPCDPRLDVGGYFNEDGSEKKSGWGFWNKDFTEWFGPWNDFRDAEKAMKEFDEQKGT